MQFIEFLILFNYYLNLKAYVLYVRSDNERIQMNVKMNTAGYNPLEL